MENLAGGRAARLRRLGARARRRRSGGELRGRASLEQQARPRLCGPLARARQVRARRGASRRGRWQACARKAQGRSAAGGLVRRRASVHSASAARCGPRHSGRSGVHGRVAPEWERRLERQQERAGASEGVGGIGERAQKELRWRISARDAGTRWHRP
jgi:hypothetical protein